MDYKHIDGLVYSRYASTPPVINSDLAHQYGIKVPCNVEPGQFSGFEVGKNVKLRLVVAGGAKKITCHAKIDWVQKEESTDEYYVGFGNLSLTDEEFQVLQSSFIENKGKVLWEAEGINQGIYVCRILCGRNISKIMKMVLIK